MAKCQSGLPRGQLAGKRPMLIFGINLMLHRLRTAWTRMFRYFLEKWTPHHLSSLNRSFSRYGVS